MIRTLLHLVSSYFRTCGPAFLEALPSLSLLREHHEVFVLSNDAIQAHLINLREGLQELRATPSMLHAQAELANEKLDAKLSARIENTNESIRRLDVKLSGQIERTNERIDRLVAMLGERIERTNEKIERTNRKLLL